MKFKKYLDEIKDNSNVDIDDPMSKIKVILSSMSDDELNEFGDWLVDNLNTVDKNTDIDDIDMDDDDDIDDDDIDDDDSYSLDDIINIIQSMSSNDLNYILFMLQDQADPDDVDDANNVVPDTTVNNESLNNVDKRIKNILKDVLYEDVTARFKASNRNHAKKRFQLTRSQLKAGKAKRKIDNIKNRAKKKAYYRKNKVKIKKYIKSYNNAVKTGQHLKKIRK